MTNDDLKRFYPINAQTDTKEGFVRYDSNGNIPGSSSGTAVGVDTIEKLDLNVGTTSIIYDTEDGITLNSQGQIEAGGRQYNINVEQNLPVKAGKGILIDTSEDGKFIEIKASQILKNLTLTGDSVLTSQETFTGHVQILVEFETDGVHGGFDCILHPYDEAICFVTYDLLLNGETHFGQAYLSSDGKVTINVPAGLNFTNVKSHYIELE